MARRIGISVPRSGWAFILLLAQVGTLLTWSYPPLFIGYNELAAWLAQLGVALILVSLAGGVSSPDGQLAPRVLWLVWVGLGAVTTLVLWVTGTPIGFYLKNAHALLFDKSVRDAFGHPLPPMIATYKSSVLGTGRALLPALLIFGLTAATLRRKVGSIGDRPERRAAVDWIGWILSGLLLLALITLPRVDAWSYLGELVAFVGAAGIMGLVLAGSSGTTLHGSAARWSFSVAVGGGAIVAGPFISALGTTNPIIGQLMWAASLWAVVLGIALVLLTQRASVGRSGARALPPLIGCVVILLAAMSVTAFIGKPYRTAPLLTQHTSTSVPELRGLLLTESDAAWIDWVAGAGVSLGARDVPAIAINDRVGHVLATSGALFAFNHSGYANPWLGIVWPAAFNSLRIACTTHPPSDLFVLQPGTATERSQSTLGVARNLAICGISFPGDFRVVDRRYSADPSFALTIWRLKGRGPLVQNNASVR